MCEQFLDPQNDKLWGRGLKIAGMEAIGAGNIGGAADGTTMVGGGGGARGRRWNLEVMSGGEGWRGEEAKRVY